MGEHNIQNDNQLQEETEEKQKPTEDVQETQQEKTEIKQPIHRKVIEISLDELALKKFHTNKEISEMANVHKNTVWKLADKLEKVGSDKVIVRKDDNPNGFMFYLSESVIPYLKSVSGKKRVTSEEINIVADRIKEGREIKEPAEEPVKEEIKRKIKSIPRHTEKLINVLEKELNSKDTIIKELTATIRGINQTLQQTNFLLTQGNKSEEQKNEKETKTDTIEFEESKGGEDQIRTDTKVDEDDSDSPDRESSVSESDED